MSSMPRRALRTETALSSRSVKRPFIRIARFDDYDQIAALEARQGLTVKSRQEWLDLWLDNPAYFELSDWPIGWVVEDEEGKIVGSLGNVPTLLTYGGRRYVSAAGRGWAVDVPYRAFSIMLLARQLKQSSADKQKRSQIVSMPFLELQLPVFLFLLEKAAAAAHLL